MDFAVRGEASAAGAALTLTIKGRTGKVVCLYDVIASYSAAPAAGGLQMQGLTSSYQYMFDIVAAGPTPVIGGSYGVPFLMGEDVSVTLAGGGAAVVGKLSLVAKWKDPNDLS